MLITRQQIIDLFTAIKTAVEGTLTVDGSVNSTVQNWPAKQEVNLSQTGTDNKVDVDFPSSQTVDGTVGVDSLPALPVGTNKIGDVGIDGNVSVDSLPSVPAGNNAIGSVDVDNFPVSQTVDGTVGVNNFPTSVEVENPTGESLDVQVTGSNAAVHESITVDASVGGVAFANYATNIYAFITAETAQMRFCVDGTAPTTTIGHLLNPGDTIELDSLADITAFRAIRTGSVSGVLKATYSGVA